MARRTRRKPIEAVEQSENRLLAGLSPQEYARLEPHLTRVQLTEKQALALPNEPIETIYFPIAAVTSVLALSAEGAQIEVATVGNEGLIGLPVFLGAETSPAFAFAQVAGTADGMSTDVFRREAAFPGPFREVIQLYTQAFLVQVSQSTVCNQFHSTQQRLARWLLSVQDRVGRTEFPLTQRFIAQMLGVRRETVSEVAAALQSLGLITYRRGRVTVRDRPALELAACTCYRIVRDEFDRLLDRPFG